MKPYWQYNGNEIYHGDALEILKQLPDESVNCCVTSPPYWGLRDYGTASWKGGDSSCDHKYHVSSPYNANFNERWGNATGQKKQESERHDVLYKEICGKCGAIRIDQQLGLEKTPEEYVSRLVRIFQEVKRILRNNGTLWLNLGDSYATPKNGNTQGTSTSSLRNKNYLKLLREQSLFKKLLPPGLKPKDIVGIPWRVGFALQADGWYLRQDIIWSKPNPIPESVKDRCTKAHEYIFLLSKNQRYFYDADAIAEPCNYPNEGKWGGDNKGYDGDNTMKARALLSFVNNKYRNKRSVWTCSTMPFPKAHFATFPEKLIEPCILAGCPKDGIVLDPFFGAGTTGIVAYKHDRKFIGIDLSEIYLKDIAIPRLEKEMAQLKLFTN